MLDAKIQPYRFELIEWLLCFLMGCKLFWRYKAGHMKEEVAMFVEQPGVGKLGSFWDLRHSSNAKPLLDVLQLQSAVRTEFVGDAVLFEGNAVDVGLKFEATHSCTLLLFGRKTAKVVLDLGMDGLLDLGAQQEKRALFKNISDFDRNFRYFCIKGEEIRGANDRVAKPLGFYKEAKKRRTGRLGQARAVYFQLVDLANLRCTTFFCRGQACLDSCFLCSIHSYCPFCSSMYRLTTSKVTEPTEEINLERVHRDGRRLFNEGNSSRKTRAVSPLMRLTTE